MNLYVAVLDEVPPRSQRGQRFIVRDRLPNGIPFIAVNPSNFDFVISMAQEKSLEIQTTVSVVVIDLQEILESDFISPDSVEGLPDWVSVN